MAYTYPTVTDFKTYFNRGFPYQPDGTPNPDEYIQDGDISRAQDEAKFNVNQGLFSNQAEFNIGFNYLTAHYLCIDLQNASQGINGKFNWLETSKSAGSVSQGFTVPQKILDNPQLALMSQTRYGAKYLSLILPRLVGRMFTVPGRTHA